MSDENRRNAERLAELARFDGRSLSPMQKDLWAEAWLAGYEAMRAVHDEFCEVAQDRTDEDFKVVREACFRARDELKVERERSHKLIEALKFYADRSNWQVDEDYGGLTIAGFIEYDDRLDGFKANKKAIEAIAEYEAGK